MFLLAERHNSAPLNADQRTVLRSWAINDFNPSCPQYVQLLLPQHKRYLEKVNATVLCLSQFKYALLAKRYPSRTGRAALPFLCLLVLGRPLARRPAEGGCKLWGIHGLPAHRATPHHAVQP